MNCRLGWYISPCQIFPSHKTFPQQVSWRYLKGNWFVQLLWTPKYSIYGNLLFETGFVNTYVNHSHNPLQLISDRNMFNKLVKLLKLYGSFSYGWDSTASMLEPLRGNSLLFTTTFPEVSGSHFAKFGRMKGWVDLKANQ